MAYRSDQHALEARAAALQLEIETAERDIAAARREAARHRDRADRVERAIAAIRRGRAGQIPWRYSLVLLVVVMLPLLVAYLAHGR